MAPGRGGLPHLRGAVYLAAFRPLTPPAVGFMQEREESFASWRSVGSGQQQPGSVTQLVRTSREDEQGHSLDTPMSVGTNASAQWEQRPSADTPLPSTPGGGDGGGGGGGAGSLYKGG